MGEPFRLLLQTLAMVAEFEADLGHLRTREVWPNPARRRSLHHPPDRQRHRATGTAVTALTFPAPRTLPSSLVRTTSLFFARLLPEP
jgi:hypothetical protein